MHSRPPFSPLIRILQLARIPLVGWKLILKVPPFAGEYSVVMHMPELVGYQREELVGKRYKRGLHILPPATPLSV
jgi:hypothetical protein